MVHGNYTVQQRDLVEGLVGIARRFYGDEQRWPDLYEANRPVIGDNPTVLQPGQQLLIPGLAPDSRPSSLVRLYRVAVQDLAEGLAGIAARLWGQPERWRELYALNRGVIGDDPERLQPGQLLILP